MDKKIEFSEIEKHISNIVTKSKDKKFRHYNLSSIDYCLLYKISNKYYDYDNIKPKINLYEERYKLWIVLKDNIHNDDINYLMVKHNNLKAIKKCYKINDNMTNNSRKLAELLYKYL